MKRLNRFLATLLHLGLLKNKLNKVLKKLINKLPGGDSKLKNVVAALFLIKERWNVRSDVDVISEEEVNRFLNLNVILAEETLQVKMFMEEGEGGGAITEIGRAHV